MTSTLDRSGPIALKDRLRRYDYALGLAAIAMSFVGVIMVYSATRFRLISAGVSGHYYLDRQGIYAALGVVVMIVVASIDYRRIASFSYIIYGAVLFALVVVLSPVGSSALGSQRWFQVGPFQVQPSEIAALGVIFGLSTYADHMDGRITPRALVVMLLMAGVPMVLVIKQPDLGTGIIIGVIAMTMLVMAGVPLRYLGVLVIVGVVGVVGVVHFGVLKHYQLLRLLSFIHPNSGLQSTGYNLAQSKIAIGSGGMTGAGLFRGSQTNLAYVPAQQTDFIFTAVGEQLGFVGSSLILLGYSFIVWRVWRAMRWSRDSIGRLLCAGALAWIGYSIFQNAGMTMGIMPITGIPLPFLSYGGSATLAFFATIGIVLNVGMQRVRLK
ncbi:MAG: rod shape-determining protein RodA [Ferrimicrobium sp.]